ncbi:ABC transporter permease [Thermophilibacter sp. ZX-H10]|uniref:ABC transporter permease n=1 Tax=unclassified Thermophilibacter TaxID=2847308 RepID=UPI0040407ABC
MSHTIEAAGRAAHVTGALAKDRFILQQLVTKDFKLRYRRSVLGVIWSVLNPLLMMMIMSFVFSYFLRGSNVENYPLYLIVGNITFSLMSEATNGGLTSIISAAPLLKKVKVDRWVFPVQKVFSAMMNFGFSLIAVVVVMLFFQVMPTWHIVWMIPALFLLMLFCIGISLLIGAAAVFFRDMIHLWSVALTAWTYLTPIFWDLSLLTNAGAPQFVVWVVKANPMYNYLEMMRCAIVYQSSPTTTVLLLAAFWALLMLVIGYLVFRKTEHKFILFI